MNQTARAHTVRLVGFSALIALFLLSLLPLLPAAPIAEAAPVLRLRVVQRGDFALIGNTLGQACEAGVIAPVVGTVGACGANTSDSGIDAYWRSDSPATGQAEANTGITAANARSTAVLSLPNGAQVTHAYLYWGASNLPSSQIDSQITFERPGVFSSTVDALATYTSAGNSYQGVADVTSLVQANGPGAYRLSDVLAPSVTDLNNDTVFAGWWMAVFYTQPGAQLRQLLLYDGLDPVSNGNSQSATLEGFLVPDGDFSASLGVIAYEGDTAITGDQLLLGGTAFGNSNNPNTNFFNRSRTTFDSPISVAGDLPQTTGAAGSLSGMDVDVFDVTSQLSSGDTSIDFTANSTGDVYWLSGFITSIANDAPDFNGSQKTATDVNGGTYQPGDIVEYTFSITNSGTDSAVNTAVIDALPAQVTYVPGSIQVVSGANAGSKTDAAGDDQAEYDPDTRSVTVRLGEGANGSTGGAMTVNDTTVVSFQVQINAGVSGTITNQARIRASGDRGSGEQEFPTDDPNDPNPNGPTVITVPDSTTATVEAGDPLMENDGDGSFVVRLSQAAPQGGLTVSYTTGGSATSGADYTALSGSVTVAEGATSATVPVAVIDDANSEGDEAIEVTLGSGNGYVVGNPGSATLDVFDDDLRVATIAAGASPSEPDTDGSFVVSLAAPAPQVGLSVRYTITGTAANGTDYTSLSGTLNIPAGATSAAIPVDVIDDVRSEGNETVIATLGRNRGYILGSSTSATLTIADNDIRYVSIAVGESAAEPSTNGTFVISLAAPAPSAGMTILYTVRGTATAGSDYTALSGSLSVPANATSVLLPVSVLDDNVRDAGETVIVTLGRNTGYVLGDPVSATMVIGDDELPVATVAAGVNPAEPATNGSFTITLSGPAPQGGLTVSYTTAGSAISGSDYVALSGAAVVPAGETSVTVPVTIIDDPRSEAIEVLGVTLAAGDGYTVGDPNQARLEVLDNDIRYASIAVGESAAEPSTNGTFVISLAAPAPSTGMTILYTVGGTATAGSDYTTLSGSLSVPANATSVLLPVSVLDDNVSDAGETVIVTLGRNTGYVLGDPISATMVIGDDEPAAPVTATVAAGQSLAEPATNGSFTITLSGPAPQGGLTVSYTTGGTAVSGSDYTALSGAAIVPAGETSVTVPVVIIDDPRSEAPESLSITLAAGDGYTVGSASQASLSVGDNDIRYANIAVRANAAEPSTNGSFVITLAAPAPSTGMTILYTVGGTATGGSDYTALTGSLSVPANATSVLLPVSVIEDLVYEPTETLVVTLGRNTGYVLGDTTQATMYLRSDEVLTANIAAVANAAEPTTNGSFRVTLSGAAPSGGLTIYYTVGGTATAGSDYTALTGSLVIAPGASSGVITIGVLDDALAEGAESVIVTLGRGAGYVVGTGNTATVTIASNEGANSAGGHTAL